MSQTDWQKLTLEEKIEDLRKDMIRTMNAVNGLAFDRDSAHAQIATLQAELHRTADRLAKLELKVPDKETDI
jgi:chromosome segregation ATPase